MDLDGTLIDPFEGISKCITHALERLGLPVPSNEELHDWIGPPLKYSFGDYFAGLEKGDVGLAIDYYRERFARAGIHECDVYDGILDLLRYLAASGHTLFVATAKPTVYAAPIVENSGFGAWIDRTYGCRLDGTFTDKVDLLQHILIEEQLNASECVMVGDRRHDMEAARYHGMRAIGVLWGYGSEAELLEAGAEELVRTPTELLATL